MIPVMIGGRIADALYAAWALGRMTVDQRDEALEVVRELTAEVQAEDGK